MTIYLKQHPTLIEHLSVCLSMYLPAYHHVCISINISSRERKREIRRITSFIPPLSLHSIFKGQRDLGCCLPCNMWGNQKGHVWSGWRIRGSERRAMTGFMFRCEEVSSGWQTVTLPYPSMLFPFVQPYTDIWKLKNSFALNTESVKVVH